MYTKDALQKRRAELSAAKQALLAQQLRGGSGGGAASTTIPRRPSDLTHIPLSAVQERFWFLQQLDPSSVSYVALNAYQLHDIPAVVRAARELVRRHEILRTTYHLVDGQVFQSVDPVSVEDLNMLLRIFAEQQGPAPQPEQEPVAPRVERQLDCQATVAALAPAGIVCPTLDAAHLRVYLADLKQSRIVEAARARG